MHRRASLMTLASGLACVTLGGCLFAAAGAGAGAAIHLSDRGVESVVTAPVDRVFSASREALKQLGVSEGKIRSEQADGVDRREIDGFTNDRELTVSIKTEGTGSHVSVVAKTSAVTWDKPLARRVLETILEKLK